MSYSVYSVLESYNRATQEAIVMTVSKMPGIALYIGSICLKMANYTAEHSLFSSIKLTRQLKEPNS